MLIINGRHADSVRSGLSVSHVAKNSTGYRDVAEVLNVVSFEASCVFVALVLSILPHCVS